jgi:hypothetical protein
MLSNLKEECPNTWENAKMDIPGGEIWLNAAPVSASVPVTGNASLKPKIDVVSAGLAVAMLML